MLPSPAEYSCSHCATRDADQIEYIGIVGRDESNQKVCKKFWCNACARAFYVWVKEIDAA